MVIEANLELKELSKIIAIPDVLYDNASLIIDNMANDHTHMNVSNFVDLCLNIAKSTTD